MRSVTGPSYLSLGQALRKGQRFGTIVKVRRFAAAATDVLPPPGRIVGVGPTVLTEELFHDAACGVLVNPRIQQ